MPNRFLPAPLSATINSAVVRIGGVSFPPHQFANPVPQYGGEHLFCHATSDGTILTILIDDNEEPITPTPAQDASIASITVNFDETPTPEHWDVPNIAYKAGNEVTVAMQLDENWANATLSIGEPPAPSGAASLGYVLVQVTDPGGVESYDVYWLDDVSVDATDVQSATIIPDGAGGMAGPFGIALP
ncbi:MAG: hypothetical protein QOJ39_123 [Candidatus Eremiobacteraeota bacterium]|jgi:hypothetical protein|nr:hypothetical protein [Candidatus Eremiobacteraeota bacterium]MEA2718259.1 hypothetical protein [Candidatus Eremiobacteraeota bacterium]